MKNAKQNQTNDSAEKVKNTYLAPMGIDELSQYLGLTVSYIYRLTSGRKIPYYQPLGKKIYFDKTEIDAWIRSKRVKTLEEIEEIANKSTKF